MPRSLDVLIGLAVIMLALGMAVTLITQFVTTVLNTRGRNLRRGLAGLLAQLDPKLTGDVARTVAKAVLTHPLVSTATGRLGTVVHREEFMKLLLAQVTAPATPAGPTAAAPTPSPAPPAAPPPAWP